MEKVRQTAVLYYFSQGIAVGVWWLIMFAAPQTQIWFRLDADSVTSLYAFWLGDLVLVASGSILAAVLLYYRWKHVLSIIWLVNGAIAYATFYTFAYALRSDLGWAGVGLMFVALLWSGVFAIGLTFGHEMFRESRPRSVNFTLFKTFAQIVIVWGVILGVFPLLISAFEAKIGIPQISFPAQRPIAAFAFLAISGLGVWAAIAMGKFGEGTPLPLDHATKLVISGPYRFVRTRWHCRGSGRGSRSPYSSDHLWLLFMH